jgi:hypothetical protein
MSQRQGGEVMHPDHYDIREEIRLAVLEAIDGVTVTKMSDAELHALFRALDPIAERLFLKRMGL